MMLVFHTTFIFLQIFMYQLLRIRPVSAVICRELTIEHFQLKMITGQ